MSTLDLAKAILETGSFHWKATPQFTLASAESHGIRHLVHRSKSSSALPSQPSATYRSIETFHALMGPRRDSAGLAARTDRTR